MVPEVMTTLLKRSNTGLMASEGSRQLLDVSQASHSATILSWLDIHEVENGIWYSGIVSFKRLQDQQET